MANSGKGGTKSIPALEKKHRVSRPSSRLAGGQEARTNRHGSCRPTKGQPLLYSQVPKGSALYICHPSESNPNRVSSNPQRATNWTSMKHMLRRPPTKRCFASVRSRPFASVHVRIRPRHTSMAFEASEASASERLEARVGSRQAQ